MPYCEKEKVYCERAGITGVCDRTAPCKFQMESQTFVVPEQYEDPYIKKLRAEMEAVPDQSIKADAGKPRVSLVPSAIVRAIARVREYGLTRYTDPDNWKRVSVERYRDAMYRHVLSYIDDPTGVDEESGLPHLWHIATNVDFLCELEEGNRP